jgi:Transposase IS4
MSFKLISSCKREESAMDDNFWYYDQESLDGANWNDVFGEEEVDLGDWMKELASDGESDSSDMEDEEFNFSDEDESENDAGDKDEDGNVDSDEGERMEIEEEDLPWNWNRAEIRVPIEIFHQPSGHNTRLSHENSALDIFSLFFTKQIITLIVVATNLHAQHIIGNYQSEDPIRHRLEKEWYPVTEEEMRAFMAMFLYAGLVQVKSWKDYFSTDPNSFSFNPIFNRTFSAARWLMIKRFLYFEVEPVDPTNKLGKVWTIYSALKVAFKRVWIPFQKVTCDEGKFKCFN